MDEQKARKILEALKSDVIRDSGGLSCVNPYVSWHPDYSKEGVSLDAKFTADQLEAIAWWMRWSHTTNGRKG